ncbi:MAG TPA: hypothetical protein VFX96_16070 [Pyrinomonadaceae bacterium]|nr:hypothetical protein [Pyrinomonadaceae bacterium]
MKYFLTLVVGLLVGGALVYFLLVGAPRMEKPPGEQVRAPDPEGDPPGTVVLVLNEQFFGTVLDTIFRDMSEPSFRLSNAAPGARPATGAQGVTYVEAQAGGCQNQITIAARDGQTVTGVKLADGRVAAPLAFRGSYNVFGNCLNFRGSALANIQLIFKQEEQVLYGQINVEGVNLEGVSPAVSPFVTSFVQTAINQRINPLVLLRSEQFRMAIPVQATSGTLRAQARDVRQEVKDGALRLHITYDFSGAPGTAPPTTPQPSS